MAEQAVFLLKSLSSGLNGVNGEGDIEPFRRTAPLKFGELLDSPLEIEIRLDRLEVDFQEKIWEWDKQRDVLHPTEFLLNNRHQGKILLPKDFKKLTRWARVDSEYLIGRMREEITEALKAAYGVRDKSNGDILLPEVFNFNSQFDDPLGAKKEWMDVYWFGDTLRFVLEAFRPHIKKEVLGSVDSFKQTALQTDEGKVKEWQAEEGLAWLSQEILNNYPKNGKIEAVFNWANIELRWLNRLVLRYMDKQQWPIRQVLDNTLKENTANYPLACLGKTMAKALAVEGVDLFEARREMRGIMRMMRKTNGNGQVGEGLTLMEQFNKEISEEVEPEVVFDWLRDNLPKKDVKVN